ncbi:MAG: D-alanyl-D-alanine carboxypeptidase [Solobacterium sp.]|nr:D-alanyl-D-alanine carboxypeptidase [Solobacterium sp.]
MMKKVFLVFLCFFLAGCAIGVPDPHKSLKKADIPDVYSEYIYIYDYVNDQVLYQRKGYEKMYPASLTKMMTAIVAIEECEDLDDTFLFTEEVLEGLVEANANRAGFDVGDEPAIIDLIYGDLLSSGADCSRGLAYYLAGSEAAYVEMMNAKAAELGMIGTHFVNTSGLFDPDHYTTCEDMGKLLKYCLQNETFREVITAQDHRSIPVNNYPNGLNMTNLVLIYINQDPPKARYSFTIPGFISGKGGYTETSRFTLASYGYMNDLHVLMVTGKAFTEEGYPANMEDAEKLYPWVFSRFKRMVPVHAGDTYTVERVRWSEGGTLKVRAADNITADIAGMHQVTILSDVINAPVKVGDKIGEVEIYSYEELAGKTDLISTENRKVTWKGVLLTLGYELSHDYLWVISLVLLGVIVLLFLVMYKPYRRMMIHRKRRKR